MNGDFLTVCHTCAARLHTDAFERADDFYTEHEARGHAVETLNLALYDRQDGGCTGESPGRSESRSPSSS